eukprot:1173640-Rhodomonas_salina.1
MGRWDIYAAEMFKKVLDELKIIHMSRSARNVLILPQTTTYSTATVTRVKSEVPHPRSHHTTVSTFPGNSMLSP